jgi:hypothetical protein
VRPIRAAQRQFGSILLDRWTDQAQQATVTNTYTVALPTYHDNAMFRDVFNAHLSYSSGCHDLKFGYEYMSAGQKIRTG